jgi:hypothetical protein
MTLLFFISITMSSLHAAEELDEKWKNLEPGKWNTWFELADACLQSGTEVGKHRARVICEALSRLDSTPHGNKARHRLALLYSDDLAKVKFLRSADLLLSDLTARLDFSEAEKSHQLLKDKYSAKKERLIVVARTAFERRDFRHAMEVCCQAHVLPGDVDKRYPFLDIISALQGVENQKVREVLSAIPPLCAECNGKGNVKCPMCGGARGPGGFKQRPICSLCRGTGIIRCKTCMATGYNRKVFTSRELRALYSFMKLTRSLMKTARLGDALKRSVNAVLSYACCFPHTIHAKGSEASMLIPIKGRKSPRNIVSIWKESAYSKRTRILLDVAVTTFRYCGTAPLFVPVKKISGQGNVCGLDCTPVFSPPLLAAFPKRFHRRWVTMQGKIGKVEKSGNFKNMRRIHMKDLDPESITILVWDRTGLDVHGFMYKYARKAAWLTDYAKKYNTPEINDTLDNLMPGNIASLTGRIYAKKDSWPAAIFEVWRIKYKITSKPSDSKKEKPLGSDSGNPLKYLKKNGSLGKAKMKIKWDGGRLLDMGNHCLAKALDLGVENVLETNIRTAWKILEALEEAREIFRIMKEKDPNDALSDELFTMTTRYLLKTYERTGRK